MTDHDVAREVKPLVLQTPSNNSRSIVHCGHLLYHEDAEERNTKLLSKLLLSVHILILRCSLGFVTVWK